MTKGVEWTMLALAYLRVCGQVPKDQQAEELDWVITGLGECEGLDESGSGTTRIDNIANVSGVEDHDAFSVRFLDEVAQHGDTPDYSMVTLEVKNHLSVVNQNHGYLDIWLTPYSRSTFPASAQAGKAVPPTASFTRAKHLFWNLDQTSSSSHVEYVPPSSMC
jgi:hypothetical protein